MSGISGMSGATPIEIYDAEFEDLAEPWVCPTCSKAVPFPRTECLPCSQGADSTASCTPDRIPDCTPAPDPWVSDRIPWLSGAGLTSSLIGAVAAIGTLIASLARLG